MYIKNMCTHICILYNYLKCLSGILLFLITFS